MDLRASDGRRPMRRLCLREGASCWKNSLHDEVGEPVAGPCQDLGLNSKIRVAIVLVRSMMATSVNPHSSQRRSVVNAPESEALLDAVTNGQS